MKSDEGNWIERRLLPFELVASFQTTQNGNYTNTAFKFHCGFTNRWVSFRMFCYSWNFRNSVGFNDRFIFVLDVNFRDVTWVLWTRWKGLWTNRVENSSFFHGIIFVAQVWENVVLSNQVLHRRLSLCLSRQRYTIEKCPATRNLIRNFRKISPKISVLLHKQQQHLNFQIFVKEKFKKKLILRKLEMREQLRGVFL